MDEIYQVRNWCKVSPRTGLAWWGGYLWSYPLTYRQVAVCPPATLIDEVSVWNRMEWRRIFDILTPFWAGVWSHTHKNIQFTRVTFICLRLPHLSSWLEPWTAAPLNQTPSIHTIELLHRCVHCEFIGVCVYLCLSEWRASVNSWKASFNKSNDRRRAASPFEQPL